MAVFAFILMANRSLNALQFHPESDYLRYRETAANPAPSDLPLAYLAMRLYTLLFGAVGLNLLSLTLGSIVLAFFMYHLYREDRWGMYCVFPALFIGNLGLRQQLMGNLRCMLGFTIVIVASHYGVDAVGILASSLAYFPSAVYYVAYKTIKRENLKHVYASFAAALI